MNSLLNKIKRLNEVFKQSSIQFVSLDKLCKQLSEIIGSNIYISDINGKILTYATSQLFDCEYTERSLQSNFMPQKYIELYNDISLNNNTLINIYEAKPSCSYLGHEVCIYKDMYISILPIINNMKPVAYLTLIRYENKFDDDEIIVCEYTSAIVSIEIYRRNQETIEKEVASITRAKVAISVLSYTELQAINAILLDIKDGDGLVVVNKIANTAFITRSVVSNALRKLESAEVIKTKSLGVKGTHIKILNIHIYDEIKNFIQ